MLHQFLLRFRTWQFTLDTTRRLNDLTDRQLADMGIERDNIAAIAARSARLDKRLHRITSARTAVRRDPCGATIPT